MLSPTTLITRKVIVALMRKLIFSSTISTPAYFGMNLASEAILSYINSGFLCFLSLTLMNAQPFTHSFPRADIHELLSPDLLHQLIKGTFKDHLVDWVGEYLIQQHGRTAALEIMDDIDHRSVLLDHVTSNNELTLCSVYQLSRHTQACADFQMVEILLSGQGTIRKH